MKISATGHRPVQKDKKSGLWISKLEFVRDDGFLVKGNSLDLFRRLTDLFAAYLRAHPEVEVVIQGMAQGVDLSMGVAALQENRTLHSYVPHKGHGEGWKTFWKDVHAEVLSSSHKVFIPEKSPTEKEIPSFLLQRNKDMVNAADEVVALWDGSGGGTGHCVRYAESVGKRVTNLWSSWEKYRGRV